MDVCPFRIIFQFLYFFAPVEPVDTVDIVDTVDTADIVHTVDTLDNVKSVNSVDNVSSVNSVHNVPVLEHVPLSASFRKDPEGPLSP